MTESELPPAADPYQPDPPVTVPAPVPLPYGYPVAPPPRRKSKALKIVLISLAAVFALCVSGSLSAFIWVRNNAAQPSGAQTPAKAADAFLTAYYRAQRAEDARKATCPQARDDKKIAAQIAEITRFAAAYDKPTFTWDSPRESDRTASRATVRVQLTMTTEDMKASKQQLTLDAVQDKGWWICAVRAQ
jgi:hypothetical protein